MNILGQIVEKVKMVHDRDKVLDLVAFVDLKLFPNKETLFWDHYNEAVSRSPTEPFEAFETAVCKCVPKREDKRILSFVDEWLETN